MLFVSQFDSVILAAITNAASDRARFIEECNEYTGITQKIALKNTFLMALRTQLDMANWPGRGRSR